MTEAAAIPVVRDTITHEHSDGDVVVRIVVAKDDVDRFWQSFPDSNEPVFLSCDQGAVEAIRGPLMREYKDGSLAVKLLVGPAMKRQFREFWPRPNMPAVLVREAPESARRRMMESAAAADTPAPFGELARVLRLHTAFMLNPKVWRAVGSDEEFLGYIRTLRCAVCKWTPHYENDVFVPCEAAHVRRVASGAGTSIKPPYSAIPLCPTRGDVEGCHAKQHRMGESAIGGKERVDKLRVHYCADWVWASLKQQLGFEHWSHVPPSTLIAWAEERDLVSCLPDIYLENVA